MWYTVSSLVNLFSFPRLWEGTGWSGAQLRATQAALAGYIRSCTAYDGALCAAAEDACVEGSYQVATPGGGKGCLSCYDTRLAKGPRCSPRGARGCAADAASPTGFYCNCTAIYQG